MATYFQEAEDLGSAPLTVQAQARSIDDSDPAGMLKFPVFFPYVDENSTEFQKLEEIDKRYAASRREWNAPEAQLIHDKPGLKKYQITPMGEQDGISEYEMQKLSEQAFGNESVYLDNVMRSVSARVNKMVDNIYRQVEVESMEAWTKGTITSKNPLTGASFVTDLQIDNARQQTAGTAWNDGGTNAYDDLSAWLRDGESEMGAIVGVMLRRTTYDAIIADAPNTVLGLASSSIPPYKSTLERHLTEELGHEFRFYIFENTYHARTDGGTASSSVNVWPDQWVAAIPAGGVVGATHRAPVARAHSLLQGNPGAPIDVRGISIFNESQNMGKLIQLQSQANWLTVPNEQFVWTIDAGV